MNRDLYFLTIENVKKQRHALYNFALLKTQLFI